MRRIAALAIFATLAIALNAPDAAAQYRRGDRGGVGEIERDVVVALGLAPLALQRRRLFPRARDVRRRDARAAPRGLTGPA